MVVDKELRSGYKWEINVSVIDGVRGWSWRAHRMFKEWTGLELKYAL